MILQPTKPTPKLGTSQPLPPSVSARSRNPPPELVVSFIIFWIFSSDRILLVTPSCVSMTTTPTDPTLKKSPTWSTCGAGGCFRSPKRRQVPECLENASGAGTTQKFLLCVVTSSWQARLSDNSYRWSLRPMWLAYSVPRSLDALARLLPWMMTPSGLIVKVVYFFLLVLLLLHG